MPLTFEKFLSSRNSEELKALCRPWGARSIKNKSDAYNFLQQTINNPKAITAHLQKQGDGVVAPLTLIKLLGGKLDSRALTLASVILTANTDDNQDNNVDLVRTNLSRAKNAGLIMGNQYYVNHFSSLYDSQFDCYIDARIANQLPKSLVPTLLNIPAVKIDSNAIRAKVSVQTVVLDLLNALKSVDAGGPLQQRVMDYAFRIPDLKRVAKAAGWTETLSSESCNLPDPSAFYIYSMYRGNLILKGVNGNFTAISSSAIAELDNIELIRQFIHGLMFNNTWNEADTSPYSSYVLPMRAMLLTGLACLPPTADFYSMKEFELAVFNRVGKLASTSNFPARRVFRVQPENKVVYEDGEAWQKRVQESWVKTDAPWINAAFTSWLYRLGLVEVILKPAAKSAAKIPVVDCFRVTDLFRALFMGMPLSNATGAQLQADATEPARAQPWIVQPNFDVLLYINEAASADLNFLEQIAERVSIAEHVANYRLSKDSISMGLRRIGDVNRIITGLTSGARRAVPANVLQQITNWATSINRVTIRKDVELVEFESEEERTNFITSQLKFASNLRPVAERFLILEAGARPAIAKLYKDEHYNYLSRAYSCRVSAGSDGSISLPRLFIDLRHCAILNRWTDPIQPRAGSAVQANTPRWQITKESVVRAINKGNKLEDLYQLLENQPWQRGIPEQLAVKLSVWVGTMPPVTSEDTVVFNFDSHKTTEGLLTIDGLKTLALGTLGGKAIVVQRHNAKAFTAELTKLGIEVTSLPPGPADKARKT